MTKRKEKRVKRGQIYYVDLGLEAVGSELRKIRPCVVVQNDVGNIYSPTTIVLPISHRTSNKTQPTQVVLEKDMQEKGFSYYVDGVVMAEQIKVVDKSRIKSLIGALLPNAMDLIDEALMVSIGLK